MDVKSILIIGLIILVAVILIRPRCYFGKNLVLEHLKEQLSKVDPNIRNVEFRESDSSYTESKKVIFLCLRNENGDLYDCNTLVYVCLHEYAHVLDPEISEGENHTASFHRIFNRLLDRAISLGLYDPNKPLPNIYCGIKIPNRFPARKD